MHTSFIAEYGQWVTLATLAAAMFFFVNGRLRSDIVALASLLILTVSGILNPEEALSGFSNPIVIMMVGLFVVGGGIFQTGLAKIIGNKIVLLAGDKPYKLYLLVMLTTAGIGAFVSNTGTVALMLPIVVSLAAGARVGVSRLLMPMAFASSMGGMMTLIGTPPNLVISNELEKAGYEALSFFSFTPVGLIAVALGIVALWPLSKSFLSKKENKKEKGEQRKSLESLAKEYQLSENLYRVLVKAKSPLLEKQLQDLDITRKYNLNLIEIRRKSGEKGLFSKSVDQKMAGPQSILLPNDVLYVLGEIENIQRFVEENQLEWIGASNTSEGSDSGKLKFDDIGIAEVVILSNSNLVNVRVKDSGFRNQYHLNILGIQRSKQYILKNVKEEKIHSGDVLLVQGEWSNIALLNNDSSNWVVVGQPLNEASKLTLDHKAPLAAIILTAMVGVMAFNLLPSVIAVLTAAMLMILTGCLRNVEAAYKTINWESIVLIGAMLPMSMALEKTGVSAAVSSTLVASLGAFHPIILLAGIYLTTSLTTMFISNTATAVLLAPIAITSALKLGLNPVPFLFAVAVAASMCFASPFSTPPNALVMSAGRYSFMDYVKVGLPLQLLFALVMVLVLPLLFPF